VFSLHQRLKLVLRARYVRKHGDPEIAHLPRLVGEGRRAIDIGANRGVYSYWLSRCCDHVEAFEPNPDPAERIRRSAIANVHLHDEALSDCKGEAEFRVPRHYRGGVDHPGGRLGDIDDAGVAARFTTLLARLDDFTFSDVDFIKIDVEGHEEKVLDGAMETIGRCRPAVLIELEERHNPGCVARVRDRFAGLGYVMVFIDNGAWHPVGELGDVQAGPSGRYINNFLLTDRVRAAALAG
jgi:FkbM family methyltransferase